MLVQIVIGFSYQLIALNQVYQNTYLTLFSKRVDEELKVVCLEIEKRYEIKFLEMGISKGHVHFPRLAPKYPAASSGVVYEH